MTAAVKVVPLGDLCHVVGGGTPPKDRPDYYDGDIPWATVRDMRTDVISKTEFKITKAAVAASATNVIPAGNVVIATRVGLGKVCLIEQPTAINQDLRGVIPRDLQRLSVRYLYWWLKSVAHLIEKEGTGATVQGVKLPFVKSLGLPLQSLADQCRIATILDEAFEGIATAKANAEKNLQNARELFDNALQSLLRDSDGDRVQRNMADVCDIPSRLVDPREETYQDLPHVGAGNIEAKTGALIDVLSARQEQLISGKFLFDESMVLYSKIRPYLMKVVRPDFSGLCSADIYPLAPKHGVINRDYLFYLLLSPDFTAYAIKGSARAGMPKVNRVHLFAYEFSLPPVLEQEQIAARLDALAEETQRLIAVYERKLADLEELKKSLLHQAFSGQLNKSGAGCSPTAIGGKMVV